MMSRLAAEGEQIFAIWQERRAAVPSRGTGYALGSPAMKATQESHEPLSEAARNALQDLKQATHEALLKPVADKTHEMAGKAQASCQALSACTRNEAERLETWACKHPMRSVTFAFVTGVLIGIAVFRE
jgi:hypothetical protein